MERAISAGAYILLAGSKVLRTLLRGSVICGLDELSMPTHIPNLRPATLDPLNVGNQFLRRDLRVP